MVKEEMKKNQNQMVKLTRQMLRDDLSLKVTTFQLTLQSVQWHGDQVKLDMYGVMGVRGGVLLHPDLTSAHLPLLAQYSW